MPSTRVCYLASVLPCQSLRASPAQTRHSNVCSEGNALSTIPFIR